MGCKMRRTRGTGGATGGSTGREHSSRHWRVMSGHGRQERDGRRRGETQGPPGDGRGKLRRKQHGKTLKGVHWEEPRNNGEANGNGKGAGAGGAAGAGLFEPLWPREEQGNAEKAWNSGKEGISAVGCGRGAGRGERERNGVSGRHALKIERGRKVRKGPGAGNVGRGEASGPAHRSNPPPPCRQAGRCRKGGPWCSGAPARERQGRPGPRPSVLCPLSWPP